MLRPSLNLSKERDTFVNGAEPLLYMGGIPG